MIYYLIEDFSKDIVFPEDKSSFKVVALNQQVYYCLEQCGIDFEALEDYYSSGEMRGDTKAYLSEQLKWLSDFDYVVQDIFDEAKRLEMNVASLYFHHLKYLVDNIILTTKILKKFCNTANPTRIIFCSQKYANDEFDCFLAFRGAESTYSRVCGVVAKQLGIEFERVQVINKIVNNAHGYRSKFVLFKESINKILKPLPFKFSFSEFFQNFQLKTNAASKQNSDFDGRVLFLTQSPYILDMTRSLLKKNISVYWLSRRKMINAETGDIVENVDALNAGQKLNLPQWASVEQKLSDAKILDWIDDHAGAQVTPLIMSRLKKCLLFYVPEIIKSSKVFEQILTQFKINAVAVHVLYTPEALGALDAARRITTCKKIGLSHGCDVSDSPSRLMFLEKIFDYYYTMTDQEAEHETTLARQWPGVSTKFYSYSYFQQSYGEIIEKRKQKTANKNKMVLFVPVMDALWPSRPVELCQSFPMEYISLHKKFIQYFQNNPQFDFVWKGLINQGQGFDYMGQVIEDSKAKNILYSEKKLKEWLVKADYVICDIASTAYFESIFSKIPTLGLYRIGDQRVRPNALKTFDKNLQGYTNADEAIEIIDNFLRAPAGDYILPPERYSSGGAEEYESFFKNAEKYNTVHVKCE